MQLWMYVHLNPELNIYIYIKFWHFCLLFESTNIKYQKVDAKNLISTSIVSPWRVNVKVKGNTILSFSVDMLKLTFLKLFWKEKKTF